MKIYVVTKKSLEYNDEWYYPEEGVENIQAFRDKKNAQEEADKLQKKFEKENETSDFEDGEFPDMFKVQELEVADDQVDYLSKKEKARAAAEESRKLFKEYFLSEFKKIFDKYKDLKAVSFDQYTDYFNDGDACHFHVQSECATLIYENEEITAYDNDDAGTVVTELLESFDSDDMENVFGDHKTIKVTRTLKIEVEENEDHD